MCLDHMIRTQIACLDSITSLLDEVKMHPELQHVWSIQTAQPYQGSSSSKGQRHIQKDLSSERLASGEVPDFWNPKGFYIDIRNQYSDHIN